MTQQEIHAEAPLSFLAALVYTLREIEETQPEPGFRDVFMGLLDKNLEGAIAGDAEKGLDTRDQVQAIRSMLGKLFISADISDAVDP